MSDGIDLINQAGLKLPYWLSRWVAGTVDEAVIPWPASGTLVAKLEQIGTL